MHDARIERRSILAGAFQEALVQAFGRRPIAAASVAKEGPIVLMHVEFQLAGQFAGMSFLASDE